MPEEMLYSSEGFYQLHRDRTAFLLDRSVVANQFVYIGIAMLNVYSPGHEPYVAADPLSPLSFVEILNLAISFFVDLLKVLVLSVPVFLQLIKEIFISSEKKVVRGWTALVTGGAHGIGKAIATELSREGCNIVIADIDGNAARETAKELIAKFHVKAVAFEVDIADYKILSKLKSDIENEMGPVDILVNNAGIMPLLSLREGNHEDVERIVSVNFTSHFHTVRTFLKEMIKKRRGHIVTISSMSSLHHIPGAIIYSSTKSGVAAFTRTLEQEIRQEGLHEVIHFTSVHPYFVATRKDLMNCLNLRIPAITAEKTGKETVDGVLRNAKTIIIPKYMSFIFSFMRVLPYEVQDLIRDFVFKEKEIRLIKDPENYVVSKKYN